MSEENTLDTSAANEAADAPQPESDSELQAQWREIQNDPPVGDDNSADEGSAQPDAAMQTDGGDGADDAELAELARGYGFAPDEVKGYSKAEFERYASLFDRRIASQIRAQREGAQAQPTTEQTAFEPQTPAETTQPQSAFELDWGEDGKDAYDPVVVKNLEAIAGQFNALRQSLEGQYQEAAQHQFYEAYDALVSELDPELFGSDLTRLTPEQIDNRLKLHEEYEVLTTGLRGLGHDTTLSKALVNRALKLGFSDTIQERERQKLSNDVLRQSRQRSPSGTRSARETPATKEGTPESDPELRSQWREIQELAGVSVG